jgi:hypothetical protein
MKYEDLLEQRIESLTEEMNGRLDKLNNDWLHRYEDLRIKSRVMENELKESKSMNEELLVRLGLSEFTMQDLNP